MRPTNNAVRLDATPGECSGDFCHGLLNLRDEEAAKIEALFKRLANSGSWVA